MPRIPTQVSQSGPQGGGSPRGTGAGVSGPSGRVSAPMIQPSLSNPDLGKARGLSSLSKGVRALSVGVSAAQRVNKSERDKIARELEAKRRYEEGLWVESKISNAQRHWMKWMDKESRKPSQDLVERFETSFNEFMGKQVLEVDVSDTARDALQISLGKLQIRLLGQSVAVEAKAKAQDTIITLNTLIQNASDMMASSNDPAVLKEQQARLRLNIKEAEIVNKITPQVAQSFNASIDNLSADMAEHLSAINPVAAKEIIENASGISLNRRTAILDKINRAVTTHNHRFELEQEQLLDSHVAQIQKSGTPNQLFDMDVYKSSKGKRAEGSEFIADNRIKMANTFYSGKSQMQGKTEAEILGVLKGFEPKEGAEFAQDQQVYNELKAVAKDQIDQISEDPFSYSMQDPVVTEFSSQASAEGLSDRDRAQMNQQVIDASLSVQSKLGIQEGVQRVTSLDAASILASRINNAPAETIGNELKNLQETYGRHYPALMRDLSRLPRGQAINTSIQIAELHANKGFTQDFIASTRVDQSSYNFPSDVNSDIKDALIANSSLQSIQASIVESNPILVDYANDFQVAVSGYAKFMLNSSQVSNPREAVELAANRLIESEFDFGTSGPNDAIFMINKSYVTAVGEQKRFTDNQVTGINRSLSNNTMKKEIDIDLVDSSRIPMTPNLDDGARREKVRDMVFNEAYWVVSPDVQGVTLHMPGDESMGGSEPMRFKDGSPVKFSYLEAWLEDVNQSRIKQDDIEVFEQFPRP